MSRTLRRPMFRKGGNVGTGIMSGVVDRSMHAEKPFVGEDNDPIYTWIPPNKTEEDIYRENPLPQIKKFKPEVYENINIEEMVDKPKSSAEYIEELRAGAGDYGGMDPLTSFLLTAGPSVAGATSFSDAVSRLQPATQQLIKGADAKAKYNRDLRLAGVKLGISAEDRAGQQTFDLKKLDLSQANQVKFRNDEKAYLQLKGQEKKDYDEVIAKRTRALAKLDERERKAWELKMIEKGKVHELKLIKRREKHEIDLQESKQKFQKDLYDKEREEALKYTGKDFIEDYENSTHANNRALYENEVREEMNQTFGHENNGGVVLSEEGTGNSWQKDKSKKENIGKVFFNLNDGKYYKFDYGLNSDGEKVTGWTTIDNLKDYKKPDPIKEGDVVKRNWLDQRVLTQKSAQKIADERGYILIGETPKSYRRKGQEWIAEQKELLGPTAKTLREIQTIIRKEELDKKRKLLNEKGHPIK